MPIYIYSGCHTPHLVRKNKNEHAASDKSAECNYLCCFVPVELFI